LVPAVRGAIEPIKALQQSGNGGEVPFAAPWRWNPALGQLSRNGLDGDKARLSKVTNCRAKSLSSQVRHTLQYKAIVGSTMFRRKLAQARK
jgi:hypothetical protein